VKARSSAGLWCVSLAKREQPVDGTHDAVAIAAAAGPTVGEDQQEIDRREHRNPVAKLRRRQCTKKHERCGHQDNSLADDACSAVGHLVSGAGRLIGDAASAAGGEQQSVNFKRQQPCDYRVTRFVDKRECRDGCKTPGEQFHGKIACCEAGHDAGGNGDSEAHTREGPMEPQGYPKETECQRRTWERRLRHSCSLA